MSEINTQENFPNTEEPNRIKNFHNTLNGLQWTSDKHYENLKAIFNALYEVAVNDLEYYNKHRERNKNISKLTIKVSLILGTLGGVITVLQSVKPIYNMFGIGSSDMAVIGSACFTIAAAALAWNKMFCVSGSHIRYVVAQFDLGRTITKFELNWQQWLNKNSGTMPPDKVETNAAFTLFKEFSEDIYKIIREDTQKWERNILDAITQAEQSINGSGKANNQK